MALYYVLISMSIFNFKVSWEIPCGEALYFAETIWLIHGEIQVSGLWIVWVFTVNNINSIFHLHIYFHFCGGY